MIKKTIENRSVAKEEQVSSVTARKQGAGLLRGLANLLETKWFNTIREIVVAIGFYFLIVEPLAKLSNHSLPRIVAIPVFAISWVLCGIVCKKRNPTKGDTAKIINK